jgi:hypothetical protein
VAPRSHWLTFWLWFGRMMSVLGLLWLCAFGLYVKLRNYCEDACEQPAFRPRDHWPAWIGTAVSLGLVWGGTYVLGAWRRAEPPSAGPMLWLARSSPAIFAAALGGGCYAVIAQDTIPADKPWTYTGGTVSGIVCGPSSGRRHGAAVAEGPVAARIRVSVPIPSARCNSLPSSPG